MIVLDTNVVSEVMKPAPSKAVLDWLNQQESERLHLSSVTIGEIEYGLRILPDGRRRHDLQDRFNRFVAAAFALRVLSYDEPAARCYGEIMAARKALGRPMSMPDGQIAAIARANGGAVATHNTRDFQECGIELVDPFVAAS
jgi:hypothetical protein